MKVLEECIGNAVIKFKPLAEVAALHVRFFHCYIIRPSHNTYLKVVVEVDNYNGINI